VVASFKPVKINFSGKIQKEKKYSSVKMIRRSKRL
jgi:hypothetical protein